MPDFALRTPDVRPTHGLFIDVDFDELGGAIRRAVEVAG